MLSGTLRRSFWIFIRLHFSFLLYFFSFLSIKQEVRNLVQLFFPSSKERKELGQRYFINSWNCGFNHDGELGADIFGHGSTS